MRRKTVSTIWAIVCTVLLVAGEAGAFFFAFRQGTWTAVAEIIGFLLGCVIAPIVHECGHIFFAKSQKMEIAYAKFFCFRIVKTQGKKKFSFASPFSADETQALPKNGGNMQKRARLYTAGGLIYSGVFLLLVLIVAITLTLTLGGIFTFATWGLIPYSAYLFLLNVLPLEYGSGKTDALVYAGLKKGEPTEKNMLAAMEIQGRAYAGESYAEIEESLYFSVPQLAEDEPLFAVMLDLRYRYWLDKGELQKAADCLNRLALSQEYRTDIEIEKIAAELVYMHSLNGNLERAEECGKACRAYLQEETATAKRILSAYCYVVGKKEEAEILKAQAETLLGKELMIAEQKLEKKLLDRIITA